MILDVNYGSKEKIKAVEGDNLERIETIYLKANGEIVNLQGLTCDMAYMDISNIGVGNVIENLTISNPTGGEVQLPINNEITKRNGYYNCELRLKNSSGLIKHTAYFELEISKNIFNQIAKPILNSEGFKKIQQILSSIDTYNKDLENKLNTLSSLDSSNLEAKENIKSLTDNNAKATELNKTLESTNTVATSKTTELNNAVEESKKYIEALDPNKDIPGLKLEIQGMQEQLKNKQSLAYKGSNITCKNSLEGRTTGLKLKGRILQNIINNISIQATGGTIEGDNIVIDNSTIKDGGIMLSVPAIKTNTKYTLIYNIVKNTNYKGRFSLDNYVDYPPISGDTLTNNLGINSIVFSTKNNFTNATIKISTSKNNVIQGSILKISKNIMILEGDIKEIPYFKGIQSVGDKEINLCEYMELGGIYSTGGGDYANNQFCRTSYIPVEKGKTYYVSPLKLSNINEKLTLYYYDKNKNWINNLNTVLADKYNYFTATTTGYVRIEHKTNDGSSIDELSLSKVKRQVNEGETLLPYTEPFRVPIKYKSCGKNLFNLNSFIDFYKIPKDENGNPLLNKEFKSDEKFYLNTGDIPVHMQFKNIGDGYKEGRALFGITGYDNVERWICAINDTIGKTAYANFQHGIKYLRVVNWTEGTSILSDIMCYKDEKQTDKYDDTISYELYREDTKTILLPKGEFFGEIKNANISDTIKEEDNKVILYKNVKKKILNSTDDWQLDVSTLKNTIVFYLNSLENAAYGMDKELNLASSIKTGDTYSGKDEECIRLGRNSAGIYVRVRKDRLKEVTVQAWKDYLKDNPIPVYYQVDKPYKIDLDVIETDVDTYQDTTHIMSLNSIPATLDFSIATNYGSVLNQHSQEINNLWNTINNLLVPALIDTNKNMALKAIENNL